MTRYDLRIALYVLAAVIALGLAIGYGVGTVTRSELRSHLPTGEFIAFEPSRGDGAKQSGAFQVPGYKDVYVNDFADLLDAQAELRIRRDLSELYDQTGIEMTVLTIASMKDYGHSGPIEPFATRLFDTWGIGNADRKDGVLVLVARQDRGMRIELGAGYGRTRDGDMQHVVDRSFLPAFREDRYQEGILSGVSETIYQIAGVYPGQYDSGTFQMGWQRVVHYLREIGAWALAIIGAPIAALAFGIRSYLRRRPRPCRQCQTLMIRMDEDADDEHLDGGQKLEEYLKSIDYDVWRCPDCAAMEIKRHSNWFSRHSGCPQCSYKTLRTKTTVLQAATTSGTGRKRLDYSCENCSYTKSETRTIPRKSKSSGSGRSSFGGGRSGGGGASGRW
jgi:uncharacterized protein